MIVVIDTNVIVSAIYFGGVPANVLECWGESRFEIVATAEILGEYRRICAQLAGRFRSVDSNAVLATIESEAMIVQGAASPQPVCRDPDDEKFIECAPSFRRPRPLIVSGDRDLLAVSGYRGVEVIRPRALLDRLAR